MVKKIVEKHENKVQRLLEIAPGFLTWAVLLSPFWLGPFCPLAVAFFLAFLAVFWVYRALIHTVGLLVGYRRYRREIGIDWLKEAKRLEGFNRVKHLIIIPTVKEPYEVLEMTFAAIAASKYPKDKLYIAFSIEERAEPQRVRADIARIKRKYGRRLGTVWTFVHPADLPGEVVGAAANRRWAALNAVGKINDLGLEVDDFIATTLDADMRFHPQFLARLTYSYLTEPRPHNCFFQTGVYLFDNNLWEVPCLMRIQANSITLAVLSSWITDAARKDTWSCYSVSLRTLVESDYWDPALGVDDTPFFWRAFFTRGGDFKGREFYIPVYADAVGGESWIKAHIAQYKQLLRWGWGVIVFPIAVKGFLTQKIPLQLKLDRLFYLIEQCTIWKTIAFMITFGFALLTLVNPHIRQTSLGYALPRAISMLLTGAFVLLVPATFFRAKLTRPVPAHWSFWRKLMVYLEGPLVVVNLLVYNFLPHVDAETRLMLGRRLEFWSTPKLRNAPEGVSLEGAGDDSRAI